MRNKIYHIGAEHDSIIKATAPPWLPQLSPEFPAATPRRLGEPLNFHGKILHQESRNPNISEVVPQEHACANTGIKNDLSNLTCSSVGSPPPHPASSADLPE